MSQQKKQKGQKKSSKQNEQEEVSPEMQELLEEIENDPRLEEGSEEEQSSTQVTKSGKGSESGSKKPQKQSSSSSARQSQAGRQKRVEDEEQQLTRAKPGKYITFRLAGEDYGLYILSVKEIIGMMQITKVPRTPDFVRGVINLRGKVHPVIDLRKRFGLEAKEDDERTPIIIVEVQQNDTIQQIGIVVDSVSEVLNIDAENLEDPPTFGMDLDTDFLLGLAKVEKRVVTLLDIDKILTSKQLVMMQNMEE